MTHSIVLSQAITELNSENTRKRSSSYMCHEDNPRVKRVTGLFKNMVNERMIGYERE